jgi:hypothetical protein
VPSLEHATAAAAALNETASKLALSFAIAGTSIEPRFTFVE